MSTEKLPIDSDGYLSRRRGQGGGPLALTSLVQLLTASLSVVVIVLVIQEGARLTERVAVQGRQIDDLLIAVSEYQKRVVDYEKEMAAMRAEREVELTVLRERLHALEAQIQNGVTTTESLVDANLQSGPGKTRVGKRVKRQAVNSVTFPAGVGACLQGPPGIPGRDGRDGLPGRDCPCGSQDVNECATNNGGCAQTCTNTVGSFVCSCGNGFVLNADGLSCDAVDVTTALPGALPTCQAYKSAGLDHGDGRYTVQPDPDSGPFSVYCDQTTLGGGWMRFYYKAGPNTCHNYPGVTWTGHIMGKINATDFLVSDDVNTANTELSWLFRGFESRNAVCYNSPCSSQATLESAYSIDTMQAFANLGNCRTPSGSQWSQGYTDAYVFVTGTLETLGTWTSMYVGCSHSSTAAVGQVTNIRFGGGPYHSGEFVHTSCNGYRVNYQNSITSRWNTDNTRVMWIR